MSLKFRIVQKHLFFPQMKTGIFSSWVPVTFSGVEPDHLYHPTWGYHELEFAEKMIVDYCNTKAHELKTEYSPKVTIKQWTFSQIEELLALRDKK